MDNLTIQMVKASQTIDNIGLYHSVHFLERQLNIPVRGNRASRMTGTVIPETGNR